jgi:protein SCO1/2
MRDYDMHRRRTGARPGLEVGVNKIVFWVGAASIGAIALVTLILLFTTRPALHGAVINPALPAADIRLSDVNGQPFALSALRGKVAVLYFGYTNCPDQCPLTMAHLKLAVEMLGAQASKVQVVMITTDPARDTAQIMRNWLAKFNPAFVGLVGAPEQLDQAWKAYGVTVENGGETHSNFVYVVDPAGNLRETFLPDSLPADEAADMRLLLGE